MINLRILEQLPAALFATQMFRVDTCVVKHHAAYETDSSFFAANPQRRSYIRSAFDDEFNAPMDIGVYCEIPQMQVLVVKITGGIHLAAFVFYGRELANVPISTDADVAQVLTMMQRKIGGHGSAEWTRLVRKAAETQQLQQALAASSGKVN